MMVIVGGVVKVSRMPTFFSRRICVCVKMLFVSRCYLYFLVFVFIFVFVSYFFFMIRGEAVARVPGMPTFFSLH